MISSGEYYTISNSEATYPLCVDNTKDVVIASSNTTTPTNQQFLATINPNNGAQFSFLSESSDAYVNDKSGEAYANSASALYFTLAADSDGNYTIASVDNDNAFLTVDSTDSGSKAKFKEKDSKKKQKWKFMTAERRGPQPM